MRKFFRYWFPALAWMAFIFPLTNRSLGSPMIWQVFLAVMTKLFPGSSSDELSVAYVVFRKSGHFIEYAILFVLLYRALRAGRTPRWRRLRALEAGIATWAYGFLDEFLQSFVPDRTGSAFDWAVDTAGLLAGLALVVVWARSRRPDATPPERLLRQADFFKRPFDVLLSGLGLVMSAPLWLTIAFLVWAQDRGPVFLAQERVGRGGRLFRAFKFRSMVIDAEPDRIPVQAVARDPRVTPVGRVLRATALDELPQLVNIFMGDMSFVGPRALRPNEKEAHGGADARPLAEFAGYRERHAVRPGLTGLAQVLLPGEAPRRKKFRYDLLYIRRWSFGLDLKLMLLSFWITLRGKWESREDKV